MSSFVASQRARLLVMTFLTLLAFAANPVLCRAALRDTGIDPASFTLIRIVAGAAEAQMQPLQVREIGVELKPDVQRGAMLGHG